MFKHIFNACRYSLAGLNAAFKEELAFRLVLGQAIIMLSIAFYLPLEYTERSFLIFAAGLCVVVELLNSAIENIVDLVTSDWHILAKRAKDMGSAAQFAALVLLYWQLAVILKKYFCQQ